MQFHIWRSTLKHTLLCDYYHKSLSLNIEDDLTRQTYKVCLGRIRREDRKTVHTYYTLYCDVLYLELSLLIILLMKKMDWNVDGISKLSQCAQNDSMNIYKLWKVGKNFYGLLHFFYNLQRLVWSFGPVNI